MVATIQKSCVKLMEHIPYSTNMVTCDFGYFDKSNFSIGKMLHELIEAVNGK